MTTQKNYEQQLLLAQFRNFELEDTNLNSFKAYYWWELQGFVIFQRVQYTRNVYVLYISITFLYVLPEVVQDYSDEIEAVFACM